MNYRYYTNNSIKATTGLVAAYNMIPSNGTLVDISGNGLNFTIPSGIHQNKDYLTFYNADFIGNASSPRALTLTDAQVAGRLNFTGNFTIMVRARVKSHSDFQGLLVKGTSSEGWRCYIDGANNQMRANLGNQLVSPPTAHTTMGNWNTFVYILRPGVSIGFWLNGIDLGSVDITRTVTTTNNDFIIGALQNNTYSADADFADVRIYNRELTEQEIKDYHNSFIKPIILEDFNNYAVGQINPVTKINQDTIIRELDANDTVIKSLTIGEKYLEGMTSGQNVISSIPSNTAYGCWEFDVYKKPELYYSIQIINSQNSVTSFNGYYFALGRTTGRFIFNKRTGSTLTTLFESANSYIEDNTWYRIRITRSVSGVFTAWIRGGSFGDTWTLVSTTDGSGTNPVTDNTHTTSNYLTFNLDLAGRIGKIKIYDGVRQ